jgi:hypothetical protein
MDDRVSPEEIPVAEDDGDEGDGNVFVELWVEEHAQRMPWGLQREEMPVGFF